jgi:hypothetical protein
MPGNTVAFPKQLDLSITKMYWQEAQEQAIFYPKVAIDQPAPKNGTIKEAELSGLGNLRTILEGQPLAFDEPVEGNEKSRTFTKKGLGFQVTDIMRQDDVQGIVATKMGGELGKVATAAPDIDFWDLFNSGFATHLAMDGQYVFDASGRVLLKTGAAQNNRPSTDAALSETSLEAGLDYFRLIKNSSGRYAMYTPKVLVVPYTLDRTAYVLLNSDQKPISMDNDVNVLKNSGISVLMVPYLTSTTAWFLLSDKHGFRISWKQKAALRTWDDPATENRCYGTSVRYSVFCNQQYGQYGTTGA